MRNLLPRIYLIRHRETEWSLLGRHNSRADIPLTRRGEDAARELGQRLRNIEFVHVLANPIILGQQPMAFVKNPVAKAPRTLQRSSPVRQIQ